MNCNDGAHILCFQRITNITFSPVVKSIQYKQAYLKATAWYAVQTKWEKFVTKNKYQRTASNLMIGGSDIASFDDLIRSLQFAEEKGGFRDNNKIWGIQIDNWGNHFRVEKH